MIRYQQTEDQIERRVENCMDQIDARFLAGTISQPEYDTEVARLRDWAERAASGSSSPRARRAFDRTRGGQ